MAILFSPITQKELDDTYRPFPRRVFLMLQANERVSAVEEEMTREVRDLLTAMGFHPFADPAAKVMSLANLRRAFEAIEAQANFYYTLGEVAFDAEHIDFEMAFERFKQAVLIADHPGARVKLIELRDHLKAQQRGRLVNTDGAQFRQRLLSTMNHFLKLLPALPLAP